MGCDIHTFLEYSDFTGQDGEPYWQCMGGQFNTGRDYRMFGLLAGVRGGTALIGPRGIPEGKVSYQVEDYMRVRIGSKEEVENSYEGGVVTLETAQSWTTGHYGETIINDRQGKPWRVTNPDLHSHSWLTAGELRYVLAYYALGDRADQVTSTTAPDDREVVLQAARALLGGDSYAPEWSAVIAAMEAFEARGCKTRLIFCFDN